MTAVGGALSVRFAEVLVDHLARRAQPAEHAVLEPSRGVAQVADGFERVRDDHDRLAGGAKVVELLQAPPLELGVADGEHLVDEQDVGVHVDRHGEAEPYVHARRVVLHRRVDEVLEPGEVDDLVEALVELLLGHAEDRAVEEDVLPSGQLGMEAGSELEERGDLAVGLDAPLFRPEDVGHALEQGALSRPVLADERVRRPFGHLERHVPQRPELLVLHPGAAHDRRLQRLVALVVEAVLLRDVVDDDGGAHTSSASRRSRRWNTNSPSASRPTAHTVTYATSEKAGNRRSYSTAR